MKLIPPSFELAFETTLRASVVTAVLPIYKYIKFDRSKRPSLLSPLLPTWSENIYKDNRFWKKEHNILSGANFSSLQPQKDKVVIIQWLFSRLSKTDCVGSQFTNIIVTIS